MEKSFLRLEHLPNELIVNLFEYFHIGELYHTFYNLNYRLNQLIQSIHYLSLIITKENHNQIQHFQRFSSYLYTLIINDCLDINLSLFCNVRRLILNNANYELLKQLNSFKFPNLEHLSGTFNNRQRFAIGTDQLYTTIFSNSFPNLKSCYILGYKSFWRMESWRELPNLRVIKFGEIKPFTLRRILSACPNLYYLDVGIILEAESSSKIERHLNLKHLILRISYNNWPTNENISILRDLFACIPNLEKLSIHRRDYTSIIRKSLIKYDWLASILTSDFPLLKRFYCYLHIFQLRYTRIIIGPYLKNILNQIIENFDNIYKNRYQNRLIID